MSDRIKTLRTKRAEAWSKMQSIDDLAEREERALTVEERKAWDELEAEITGYTEDIDRTERGAKLNGRLEEIGGEERARAAELHGTGRPADGRDDEARTLTAFRNFCKTGMSGLNAEDRAIMEARAQSEGTGTQGGYLVPQGYWARITEVMKAYGGLLGIANVIDTSTGILLPWPKNDDTANVGSILGENTQISAQDVAFTTNQLQAWTYTSNLILVSLQLLQDSAFNLDAWLPGKIGQRLGRAVANHLVNGSGTSQPKGILSTVVTGKTGLTGQTTSVIYDDLVDVQHSVDPAYRNAGNVRWLMNDTTMGTIRKLKDTQGHPLWQPSVSDNAPDLLLGKPLTIDQAMPVMAANAKSILFGDFHEGYVVRRVAGGDLMRLTERYADYLQVGFFGFGRFDGQPDNTTAVKAYVNSAT